MKIRTFKLLVATITIALLVAIGCGGGGAGGGGGAVQDQLLSRMRSWSNAMKSGSLSSTMSNFSRDYYDSGTDYFDIRDLMDAFFSDGGRAWLEELEGHEYVVDGDYAARRFTAYVVTRIYGNTDREWMNNYEYFHREGGRWLIYGNQDRSRGTGSQHGPSFSEQLKKKTEKIRAILPAKSPDQPEAPIPPDLP